MLHTNEHFATRSDDASLGRCEVPNADPFTRQTVAALSDGCKQRELPVGWSNNCPLHTGGQLTCYYSSTQASAATSAEETKPMAYHGCGNDSIDPPASDSYTNYMQGLVGSGPPNPFCMTIFPPSWRMNDWALWRWTTMIGSFDPFPMLIAGIVLGVLFLTPAILCGIHKRRSSRW